ncbi:CPCC family cysteine-rich protein [Streptomyces niveiscabiei]|uniref:CPCC family cysteine-rich protein n=1 Tax=Streptomyces niveiscabiei TaxID=164115 RepID=UPI0029BACCFE|nr:CPCC family cysteine-rich protein [Streptomyces niveiscabiei]MDX3386605.1 CPCC family cysteine-rich protein [Streptomyces niveiscabiei]
MTGPPDEIFPCPCCGHLMFWELGNYDICDVCFWEEDVTQLRYPWCDFGPNGGLNLIDAQANYARIGAVREDLLRHVRPPKDDEPLDPGFRPVDLARDAFEPEFTRTPDPENLMDLYYWRPTYWRRHLRLPS